MKEQQQQKEKTVAIAELFYVCSPTKERKKRKGLTLQFRAREREKEFLSHTHPSLYPSMLLPSLSLIVILMIALEVSLFLPVLPSPSSTTGALLHLCVLSLLIVNGERQIAYSLPLSLKNGSTAVAFAAREREREYNEKRDQQFNGRNP